MEPLKMERSAADNRYLHRDFHKTLDLGLAYIAKRYGQASVEEYIRRVAEVYFAPVLEEIKRDGLGALARHIEKTYEAEEASGACHTRIADGVLTVRIDDSPALSHFKKIGYQASPYFVQTTDTMNRVIAEHAGLSYHMDFYDDETGECEYTFALKEGKA